MELVDCGHVFEVETLDRWMDEADLEGENEEIKYKRCPTCSAPILYGRRYGNIIKKILADFEAVKRRIVLCDVADSDKIQKILVEVKEIKASFKVEVEEIVQSTRGPVTSEEVIKRQNQVTILKFLAKVVMKYKITPGSNKELYHKIHSLKSRVMKRRRVCFSEQELKEFSEEMSRAKLLGLMTALESEATRLGPEDSRNMNTMRSALESGKTIGKI